MRFDELEPRPQREVGVAPFDWWGEADGPKSAEFYKLPTSYLVRVTGYADFSVYLDQQVVEGRATPDAPPEACETLYFNSIQPLIANFLGGLNLHASAVDCSGNAIAFVGASGSGKTTLAAAFARAGHPFITEDKLQLRILGNRFLAIPSRPVLRLFKDSVRGLGIREATRASVGARGQKNVLRSGQGLPFQDQERPLRAIYYLGAENFEEIAIRPLDAAASLSRLMRHSPVLDVDDKLRLGSHFNRLSSLAECVSSYGLFYPRNFNRLSALIARVVDHAEAK